MTQDDGQAGGKTPGEQAKEGVDETGAAGPERADAESIGEGGAPTGAVDSDADNTPGSTEEGADPTDD
jgi:hypothetical protein